MFGTRFGFLVDRPVSSGLEQHEASTTGVGHHRYQAQDDYAT
jgi:hypothetical protein